MDTLDHALVHRARLLITGDNVHLLNTLLFLYEKSSPKTLDRTRYEEKLRTLVAEKELIRAARLIGKLGVSVAKASLRKSDELSSAIEALRNF